jgi:hypothetical protein
MILVIVGMIIVMYGLCKSSVLITDGIFKKNNTIDGDRGI